MSLRLTILGSGSTGNCTLVASSRTTLLIDAGFSRLEILRRLQAAGEDPSRIQAVVVSHEHSDHVCGLPVLCRKLRLPAFLNRETHQALLRDRILLEKVEYFDTGKTFLIGDIEVLPITVPHDAADPVGFILRAEGVKVALVTDLGYMPENVKHELRGCDGLVLESNHDLEMLKSGPYPWQLKQRVMSRLGHLSNDALAAFLQSGYDGAAAHLVLAHLSQNNNAPGLAQLSAEQALAACRNAPKLHVAAPDAPLPALLF